MDLGFAHVITGVLFALTTTTGVATGAGSLGAGELLAAVMLKVRVTEVAAL